nr:4-oxalomesaconate tautomerase [Gammaproteobacteria bacterium]
YLTPHRLHAAHAVTGGICVGTAAMLDGTIATPLADRDAARNGVVRIEHPSGSLDVTLALAGSPEQPTVASAGIVRTARKILDGSVFVPAGVWG